MLEVVEVKARLDDALGSSAPAYWRDLQAFLHGKLSKRDWEERAAALLGPVNVALHNNFIHTLLQTSARSSVPLPPVDVPRPSPRQQAHPQSAATAAASGAAGSSDAAATAASSPLASQSSSPAPAQQPGKRPRIGPSDMLSFDRDMREANAVSQLAAQIPTASSARRRDPLVRQTWWAAPHPAPGTLPSTSAIRAQLLIQAHEIGIQHVSDDAVQIVEHAMHIYAKTLIEEAIATRGLYRLHGRLRHNLPSEPEMVTARHLFEALTRRPYLLNAALLPQQETVLLACDHPTRG